MGGIGSHERPNNGKSIEWWTPLYIIHALGEFDLDPCSPPGGIWPTARRRISLPENGLAALWYGRVWLNPPYGSMTGKWLKRMADHGNGIALIFARTETRMFFNYVWDRASAVFFFEGRLCFYESSGRPSSYNAGGPSCLVAYGEENVRAIQRSGLHGKLVSLRDVI